MKIKKLYVKLLLPKITTVTYVTGWLVYFNPTPYLDNYTSKKSVTQSISPKPLQIGIG